MVDISAGDRGDGSTLLRVTADRRLPVGCLRTLEVAGDEPRIIVTLRGVSAPDLPRSLDLDDPLLERVRLVHDAETVEGELHLVLYPAGGRVFVSETAQVGPHVVVQLAAETAP